MKKILTVAVVMLFCAGTVCFAADGKSGYGQVKKEAKGEMKAFKQEQKAEKKAFMQQQKTENKAFKETLEGKTGRDRAKAITEHKDTQKAERKDFMDKRKAENKAQVEKIKADMKAGKEAAKTAVK